MKNIPVHYAIPSRQILLTIGGCFAMVAGIIGIAFWLNSPKLAAVVALVFIAIYLWMLIRNMNAVGEASIEEDALLLMPSRGSLCSVSGPVRISWDDIDRVQVGATVAPNAPRVYVSLRTRRPGRRSWIVHVLRQEDSEFVPAVLARANAARACNGGSPLQAENPFDSSVWKFASIFLLVMFLAAIVGTIAMGKADDIYVWARILTLGAFSIPLVKQVFYSKAK